MRRIASIGAACAAALAGAIVPMALASQPHAGPQVGVAHIISRGSRAFSTNWAAFVPLADRGTRFRYVSADFVTPKPDCAKAPNGIVDDWVGFDGDRNNTVQQVGIQTSCFAPSVYGIQEWVTMYPGPSKTLFFRVNAGDHVRLSAVYTPSIRAYTFGIRDRNTGVNYELVTRCARIPTYPCPRTSAEVVAERPTLLTNPKHIQTANLADFGTVKFTNVAIGANGASGTLNPKPGHWTTQKLWMDDASMKHIVAYPSGLSDGGRAFSVTWENSH